MTDPPGPATPQQLVEILDVVRFGATAAGARGADLDDICQTVAEKLIRKWSEPHIVTARSRGGGAWHAYVIVAARNAVNDLRRSEQRRRNRELLASNENTGDLLPERPGTLRQSNHEQSTTDAFIARLVIVDLIEECLDGRTHEVAMLAFVDGLSTREIHDRLDLSIGTINTHKRTASKVLKAALSQDTPPRNG